MFSFKKWFRSIKKFPSWVFWLPARLLQLSLRILYRVEIDDPNDYVHKARGCVGVTWHNRLCFFAAIFPADARRRTAAVVSASRDGQYIADLIAHLGLKSLRGSSSRRGAHALREAIHAVNGGMNVAFTPDGPRGPKYRMKVGPVMLASLTGGKVLPISVNASSYWQLRSWDNFQIPKPGAKLRLVMGDGIAVPAGQTEEQLEEWRARVESALLAITED